jgi:hypothetical protein
MPLQPHPLLFLLGILSALLTTAVIAISMWTVMPLLLP